MVEDVVEGGTLEKLEVLVEKLDVLVEDEVDVTIVEEQFYLRKTLTRILGRLVLQVRKAPVDKTVDFSLP